MAMGWYALKSKLNPCNLKAAQTILTLWLNVECNERHPNTASCKYTWPEQRANAFLHIKLPLQHVWLDWQLTCFSWRFCSIKIFGKNCIRCNKRNKIMFLSRDFFIKCLGSWHEQEPGTIHFLALIFLAHKLAWHIHAKRPGDTLSQKLNSLIRRLGLWQPRRQWLTLALSCLLSFSWYPGSVIVEVSTSLTVFTDCVMCALTFTVNLSHKNNIGQHWFRSEMRVWQIYAGIARV